MPYDTRPFEFKNEFINIIFYAGTDVIKKTFIKSILFKMCKTNIKKTEIENDKRDFKDQCFIEIVCLSKNCIIH